MCIYDSWDVEATPFQFFRGRLSSPRFINAGQAYLLRPTNVSSKSFTPAFGSIYDMYALRSRYKDAPDPEHVCGYTGNLPLYVLLGSPVTDC